MATTLRSLRTANIGVTSIVIGNYTAPSVPTGVVITGLSIANTTSSVLNVNVYMFDGTTVTHIAWNNTVPPGATIHLADEGNRIHMNAGDQMITLASVAASIDAIMSVAEIS